MKVLHVEAGRHLYGGPRQVLYLLGGLRRAGVENVLACPAGSEVAAAAVQAGERVHEMPMRGDLDVLLAGRLAALVRRERPDIVHLHSRRGADTFGVAAARITGVKAVLTRRVDNPPSRWFTRWLAPRCARVVVISQGIAAVLAAGGVEPDRIACVPSAVDPGRFDSAYDRAWFAHHYEVPEDVPLIGVIAQLIERKGHQVLLDALPVILAEVPALRVLCFGRGPAERTLREEIARRGLGDRVTLAGFRDDMDRVIGGLDLVVHPASMEGLGVALLEAAAARRPVVACAVGGIPEIVRHEQTGLLVPPGDAPALGRAVLRLLQDPDLSRALAGRARRLVEEAFSVDAMTTGNLAVYRSLHRDSAMAAD